MSEQPASGMFSAPLWHSPFRPFYLLGVLYGLGVMGVWVLVTVGAVDISLPLSSLSLWHGHEMVFGFSGAVVAGFILTALPGWSGTVEIRGGRLAFLVLLWLLGRIAVYSGGLVPPYMVMLLDSSLYFAASLMVLPGLLAAENKLYLALIPILLMLCLGNVVFHVCLMDGDPVRASWGIQIGLMAIAAKFVLAGGFLAATFTGNALRQKGGPELTISPMLEYISALSLVLFIWAVLFDLPDGLAGSFAFFMAVVQAVRLGRWRTWLMLDAPLVLIMHLAYIWFIVAAVLFGLSRFSDTVGPHVWLHAFTVGALSLMMLSLITRVALRHTGRSLVPARAMLLSFALVFGVAFLREMIAWGLLPMDWLPVTAVIWWVAFALYFGLHGLLMIRPSLPKRPGPKGRAAEVS